MWNPFRSSTSFIFSKRDAVGGLKRPTPALSCLVALSLLLGHPVMAAVRYVRADATGNNTGLSWTHAYKELVSAIAVAQPNDEIWIATGIRSEERRVGKECRSRWGRCE